MKPIGLVNLSTPSQPSRLCLIFAALGASLVLSAYGGKLLELIGLAERRGAVDTTPTDSLSKFCDNGVPSNKSTYCRIDLNQILAVASKEENIVSSGKFDLPNQFFGDFNWELYIESLKYPHLDVSILDILRTGAIACADRLNTWKNRFGEVSPIDLLSTPPLAGFEYTGNFATPSGTTRFNVAKSKYSETSNLAICYWPDSKRATA